MTDATDDPARDELAPGTLLAGRYEVTDDLGGAAWAPGTRRATRGPRPPGGGEGAARGVRRRPDGGGALPAKEARVLATLRHRHVVEVLDFGDDAGRLYLVMELLDGESLQARLDRERTCARRRARGDRPGARRARVGARGGVVHRDVKPDNVFLRADAGRGRASR